MPLNARHLERYAEVLIWGLKTSRRRAYKRGDIILLRYHRPAIELAEIIQAKLLDMGTHPVLRMDPTPPMERNFYGRANRRQIDFIAPGEAELHRRLNGSIFLYAPESILHLGDVDPKKIGRAALARKPLRNILEGREAAGQFGWTLCVFPTRELARHARLPFDAYARQVASACFLNRTAPLGEWRRIFKQAQTIKKWLDGMEIARLHVEAAQIDLELTPGDQRRWLGVSGHNIPSFEIFISPDWRGTRGVYAADQPSFRSGNRVEGVRLEFKRGVVVASRARIGHDFLQQQLMMDPGARKVGEFSLTDKRFSKINRFMANTLFDENYGGRHGNCHIALGAAYADAFAGDPAQLTAKEKARLGFNDSALHWDLVNTQKKRVVAHLKSGRRTTIYENGRFACSSVSVPG